MACTNPIFGFPCGKCLDCRIQYSATWSARLIHELSSWNNVGCFVTLTFNDDFVGDNCLNIKDLQLFFKRLRKAIFPRKIKHFSCGEYGDSTGRRHYHSIIFGLDCSIDTQRLIEKEWPFGFVKVGTVTYDSCRYVSDYVLKKYNGEKQKKVYGSRQQPFRIMSNGLGKAFVLSDIDNFIANNGFTIRGKARGLPRYYKDVIYWHKFETEGQLAALRCLIDLKRRSRFLSETKSKLFHDSFVAAGLEVNNSFVKYCETGALNRERHLNYKNRNYAKGEL